MLGGGRPSLWPARITRFWGGKRHLSGPGQWLRWERLSPLKGCDQSSVPVRHHLSVPQSSGVFKREAGDSSFLEKWHFIQKQENTSDQTEATTRVRTLRPVEAKPGTALVWVWPEERPPVTSLAGPDGDGGDSHFLLSPVLTRGSDLFLRTVPRAARWRVG